MFKAGASTALCFFRHWVQTLVSFRGRTFQNDSGFWTLSLSWFQTSPHFRVVGFCIRSVVAILPVGPITPVGIRNCIPDNPGSPESLSTFRLWVSSGFGSVVISVARIVSPAVCRASAIVGVSQSITLRPLIDPSLHVEYQRELTARKVNTFYLTGFSAWFSSVLDLKSVSFPIHILSPIA